MNVLNIIIEKIASYPLLNSYFYLLLKVGLTPLFCLLQFIHYIKYWFLYFAKKIQSKKIIIISLSDIFELRFISQLIHSLNQHPDFFVVIFSGRSKLTRIEIQKAVSLFPVFPFGFLPAIVADLFISTKSNLVWHAPSFTHKIHIFHSPVSIHQIYSEGSFAQYNSFFAVGPHHNFELNQYLPKRGLKNYYIYNIGSELIDKYAALQSNKKESHNIGKVLYAPTWGIGRSLEKCGEKIIGILINLNLDVVFRPHPLSYIKQKREINAILKTFAANKRFTHTTGDDVEFISTEIDLMISDFSGIAFEFALGCLRPVIFVDGPPKITNTNWKYYNSVPGIELSYREKIGYLIQSPDELQHIISQIENNPEDNYNKIEKHTNELLYNRGSSAITAMQTINNILCIKNKI